ncbi:hypothetical protein B0J14DRAFT_182553 [Halenospora varia]|nr:hypothetical protein B0J14DRAFT_182553 [Halenospora varia]
MSGMRFRISKRQRSRAYNPLSRQGFKKKSTTSAFWRRTPSHFIASVKKQQELAKDATIRDLQQANGDLKNQVETMGKQAEANVNRLNQLTNQKIFLIISENNNNNTIKYLKEDLTSKEARIQSLTESIDSLDNKIQDLKERLAYSRVRKQYWKEKQKLAEKEADSLSPHEDLAVRQPALTQSAPTQPTSERPMFHRNYNMEDQLDEHITILSCKLQAADRQLQASNVHLQAANEQLQTTHGQLASANRQIAHHQDLHERDQEYVDAMVDAHEQEIQMREDIIERDRENIEFLSDQLEWREEQVRILTKDDESPASTP